jgi:hypothetical protein
MGSTRPFVLNDDWSDLAKFRSTSVNELGRLSPSGAILSEQQSKFESVSGKRQPPMGGLKWYETLRNVPP